MPSSFPWHSGSPCTFKTISAISPSPQRLAPKLALAHANLGRAYDKADRPQDVLNALDQALRLNPNLQWAVELRNQIRQRLKS